MRNIQTSNLEFSVEVPDEREQRLAARLLPHRPQRMLTLNFWPLTSDNIECGMLILRKDNNGRIIGEIFISAKSTAYTMTQEQVNFYFPLLRKQLIDQEIEVPQVLCGDVGEDGTLDHVYELPQ